MCPLLTNVTEALYRGVEAQSASSQTGYKWSFASKASKADSAAVQAAREEVGAATYKRARSDHSGPSASGSGRVQGPTLPSQSDLTMAREEEESRGLSARDLKRKRDRKEEKERVEDMVGPKEVGREGMLEKKRARRETDRAFREKGDDGFEADESTLLGGGDSFKERSVSSTIHAPLVKCALTCLSLELQRGMPPESAWTRNDLGLEMSATLLPGNVQMSYARKTRLRWTCSCKWPRRNSANALFILFALSFAFISVVHAVGEKKPGMIRIIPRLGDAFYEYADVQAPRAAEAWPPVLTYIPYPS